MKIVVCLDENNNMLFNNRRQSKDRALIADLERIISENKLYINKFSEKLFGESDILPRVTDAFLETAGEDDFCFVENCRVKAHLPEISEIIVYRWNRKYPGDFTFDIVPEAEGFKLKETIEFKGFSHEKITREIYTK